jgi:hypothetical protein
MPQTARQTNQHSILERTAGEIVSAVLRSAGVDLDPVIQKDALEQAGNYVRCELEALQRNETNRCCLIAQTTAMRQIGPAREATMEAAQRMRAIWLKKVEV